MNTARKKKLPPHWRAKWCFIFIVVCCALLWGIYQLITFPFGGEATMTTASEVAGVVQGKLRLNISVRKREWEDIFNETWSCRG